MRSEKRYANRNSLASVAAAMLQLPSDALAGGLPDPRMSRKVRLAAFWIANWTKHRYFDKKSYYNSCICSKFLTVLSFRSGAASGCESALRCRARSVQLNVGDGMVIRRTNAAFAVIRHPFDISATTG
jgi:hypothetical protein